MSNHDAKYRRGGAPNVPYHEALELRSAGMGYDEIALELAQRYGHIFRPNNLELALAYPPKRKPVPQKISFELKAQGLSYQGISKRLHMMYGYWWETHSISHAISRYQQKQYA